MCRKIYWCYIFVLTLLDISLNTKLTAQGESHGVTIHESLVEGITFQEWGKESGADGVDGNSENVEGVSLEPRALRFGRSALAAPHSRTVTLTNTANTTLHLASVAGTTPDFHASFFQSKTLAPQSNTTFNVVYLGRQEGPVSAHLYIHTSLGVHKYPVSAVGVASEYAVWPLLGVRVPLNATLEPELRLHNPTDATVQVHEIYSTGSWVRLRLPGGGERAHRDMWAVPPRSSRTLVLLRLAPHAHPNLHTLQQPLIAYVRIKANIPGGGLVVAVEARSVPAGEHARPLHVMLGPRGTGDPPHTVELVVANSGDSPVALTGGVRGVGCWRTAPPPPPLPCAAPAPEPDPHKHNGGTMSGAHLSLERTHLPPHQDFTHVGRLMLNYAELWSLSLQPTHMNGASTNWEKEKGAGGVAGELEEAWCAGCVRLGRATVPFNMRLLPGTLKFTPENLDIVTAAEDSMREREVSARNEFRHPLRIDALHLPPEVADYFHLVEHTPLVLRPGAAATLLRLRLRSPPPVTFALTSTLTVHTNLSQYSVPVRIYSGQLIFEWDWVNATSDSLELGAVGTSWTRRVGVRLRNPAPAPLCLSSLTATLPGAAATLAISPPNTKCIEGGSWAQAWLTVVAPAREASLRGVVLANTTLASTAVRLALRVRAGHVRAHNIKLPPAAPYAGSSAEVEVESSMSARMRVTALGPQVPDPALSFEWEDGWVAAGLQRVASVSLHPERRCEPACYTGLDIQTDEGAAWLRRSTGDAYEEAALREDVALLQARLARFAQHAAHHDNFTLQLHTTEVLQIAVSGSTTLHWPRLVRVDAAGGAAPLVGVSRSAPFQITVHNAAHVPLLLHALLDTYRSRVTLPPSAGGDTKFCTAEKCRWSREAFTLSGWRVTRGAARAWAEGGGHAQGGGALPVLLLGPQAEIEISVMFAPPDAATFATYLYLKNNLTILEGVQLYGQGEYPTFDISGKKPGSLSPFLFEVKDCTWGLTTVRASGGASSVSRRLVARNPGRVGIELSGWSVARGGCAERGFRVSPCAPLALPPNSSSPLLIAFAPDYSLSRVVTTLHLHSDLGPAEYILMATVPAKLISRCASTIPRPAWEPLLRSIGGVFSFIAFAIVLAVASLDAERLLRRARALRPPPDTHTPLDLNDIAHDPPPAPPPARPPPRRKRAARRPLPPMDPRAERKAFERWRAEKQREEESSRSSEDADLDIDDNSTNTPYDRAVETPLDEKYELNETAVDDEPEDTEPAPVDDDGGSTGSDVSTPVEDHDDADELYGGDVEPDLRDDSPVEGSTTTPATEPILRPLVRTPPIETNSRSTRSRRDNGETNRRTERMRHTTETPERRGTPARLHTRKERPPKRRNERAVPTPPPRSPVLVTNGGGETTETRGTVRQGETWSSVVAARAGSGPTLAPIGSDVRRREPERAPDNSLFYFNGSTETAARPEAEFAWRAPQAAERPAFAAPRDYLDEQHTLSAGSVAGVGSGYGVGLGSVWGAGAWGAWDSAPVRPPPGFAPPSPPTQRTYDPFRSLASIWAPAPHDWRPASTPAAPPTPPRDRDDPI